MESRYDYFNDYGSQSYDLFIQDNPTFDCPEFEEFVVQHNKGDRDEGELGDIALHEVLRLASLFEERRWRFSEG